MLKKHIIKIFNIETFIFSLTSDIIAIEITYLLNITVNIIIKELTNFSNVANSIHAVILISEAIPTKIAAKKSS